MRFKRITMTCALICCLIPLRAGAGIRGPGRYSGMVLFDRWGGCYLYSGVFVMYVSEKAKTALLPYDRKWITLDAQKVVQPINPGDGRIDKFKYLGPARRTRDWIQLDGLKLEAAAMFGSTKPCIALQLVNAGSKPVKVFSEEWALTILTKKSSRYWGPSDGPSYALITRESFEIGGDTPRWNGEGFLDEHHFRWTIGQENALPHEFVLEPRQKRSLVIQFDLPPGEYEFISGYGGGVLEGRGTASNSVSFDVAVSGATTRPATSMH